MKNIKKVQDELRSSGADVKWVPPENVHITFHFFGNIKEDDVGKIENELGLLAGAEKPFTVKVSGLGAFPSVTNPKVIWAGTSDGSDELIGFQKRLADRILSMGYKLDKRPFKPHFTIGRLRSASRKKELREKLLGLSSFEFGEIALGEIVLFKSDLLPTGARYTPLWRLSLEGPAER